MNWNALFEIAGKAHDRKRLTPAEKTFVAKTVPADLASFPRVSYPTRLEHPAGFKVSGAVVRTFSKCALVTAGHAALGARYGGKSPFYDGVEAMLALDIMRANFVHGLPKGAFCCPPCTLAIHPLLKAGLIRWLDGPALAPSIRKLVEVGGWRFANFKNPRMIEWSLGSRAG